MSDEKVEKLLKRRSCMKSKLTIFGNYLHMLQSCSELSSLQLLDLESRFHKFDSLYVDFDKLQSDVEMLVEDPADEGEEREQFENQYYKLVATARSLLGARPQSSGLQDGSVTGDEDVQAGGFKSNCVRLPKIDLPVFHGHYQHWLEFRDTYISLIHSRSDIDNINKLHYLRASLRSSALLVIDNLDFRAQNYESAWNLLCKRYDNKRLLVNNHVQALFNIEHMQGESCSSIRNLIDVTNKNLRALLTLGQDAEFSLQDTLLIHIMSEKLDNLTRRHWEEHRNTFDNPPSLDSFVKFLSNRADLLETLQEHRINCNKVQQLEPNQHNTNQLTTTKSYSNITPNSNKNFKNNKKIFTCSMCNQTHYLFNCEAFRALTVEARLQKAREAKVCLNCLRPGHVVSECNLVPCKYCKKKHNTLLHLHEADPAPAPVPAIPVNNFVCSANVQQNTTSPNVLLSTAIVRVVDSKGALHTARVLLDNGSTGNFVAESLCGKLGLSRRSASATVTGINNNTSHCTQSCSLTFMSNYNDDCTFTVDCHILPKITGALPSSFINIEHLSIPSGISLADPSFNIPSAIDILVGAEIFWTILRNNSIDLGKNQPKLYETKLGWLVSGFVAHHKPHSSSFVCHFINEGANPVLHRFPNIKTIAATHSLSSEERTCKHRSQKRTRRKDDGRFVVTMPLKKDPSVLGDSFRKTKCRFMSPECTSPRTPVFINRCVPKCGNLNA
ncbi:hypothetical protein PYW08_009405 [Mythimna loreyi]|uniref:Uncharacterized protein n=1 Tax=Mythimna loreyi TaxID=667449 RepID=A0ACC2QAB9_9NEOP|nr:hypothetical protein PYW08_009405 [Mythimna loreyi]